MVSGKITRMVRRSEIDCELLDCEYKGLSSVRPFMAVGAYGGDGLDSMSGTRFKRRLVVGGLDRRSKEGYG